MALIKCIECGNEISSMALACPNCGCPLTEMADIYPEKNEGNQQNANETESGEHIHEDSNNENVLSTCKNINKITTLGKRKKMIIGVCTLILVVIIAVLFVPSTKEKRAVACAKELQSMLIDPESLVLRGDIVVTVYDNDPNAYCAVIEYSAANGFGGMKSNVAYFDEAGYLGDENTDYDDIKGTTRKVRFTDAVLTRLAYLYIGEDEYNKEEVVSGAYVAKKIGCTFYE